MDDRDCWWCEGDERHGRVNLSYDPEKLKDIPNPNSGDTPTQHALTAGKNRIDLCADCASQLIDGNDSSSKDDAGGDSVAQPEIGDCCHACDERVAFEGKMHAASGFLCHFDGYTYCTACVLEWDGSDELAAATESCDRGVATLVVVRGEHCTGCGWAEDPSMFSDCQANPYCVLCITKAHGY